MNLYYNHNYNLGLIMRLILLLLTPIFLFAQFTNTDDTYIEGAYYTIDDVDTEEYYNPYDNTSKEYATELQQTELSNLENIYDYNSNNEYDSNIDNSVEIIEEIVEVVEETNNALFLEELGLKFPFKTYNFSKFKSKKMPSLLGSDGMLKNLDLSYWFLKFYGHPDINNYNSIQLFFKNSILTITLTDLTDNIVEESSYYLTPIKMIQPNEGIFAYSDKEGDIYFIYLRLLLPHLLAMDMVTSFEEAEIITDKSISELGVFVLQ